MDTYTNGMVIKKSQKKEKKNYNKKMGYASSLTFPFSLHWRGTWNFLASNKFLPT